MQVSNVLNRLCCCNVFRTPTITNSLQFGSGFLAQIDSSGL